MATDIGRYNIIFLERLAHITTLYFVLEPDDRRTILVIKRQMVSILQQKH